ncbi:MAG: YwmB family TATA-box binding protein [Clostridia bacterium]|jgi:hypothetical protein|nr:YwmB family TATA-box binding protein [Clostridia bacterium]MDD4276202.1 YwmB family TATA-box binding protein [Clostridia bacterium]
MNKNRLLSIMICLIFLIFIAPLKEGLNLLAKRLSNGTYNAYVTNFVKAETAENTENINYIQIADGGIIVCELQSMQKVKSYNYHILGESLSFYGNLDEFYNIIKIYRIKIIKTEQVGEILTIYGFSFAFNKHISIDNKKINVQIAINNNLITVGTPIILGSY